MKNKATARIGELAKNNQGLLMRIVRYVNNKKIEVEFVETGERKWTRYDHFKHGNVMADLFSYPLNNAPSFKSMKLVFGSFAVGIVAIISLIIYMLK